MYMWVDLLSGSGTGLPGFGCILFSFFLNSWLLNWFSLLAPNVVGLHFPHQSVAVVTFRFFITMCIKASTNWVLWLFSVLAGNFIAAFRHYVTRIRHLWEMTSFWSTATYINTLHVIHTLRLIIDTITNNQSIDLYCITTKMGASKAR